MKHEKGLEENIFSFLVTVLHFKQTGNTLVNAANVDHQMCLHLLITDKFIENGMIFKLIVFIRKQLSSTFWSRCRREELYCLPNGKRTELQGQRLNCKRSYLLTACISALATALIDNCSVMLTS